MKKTILNLHFKLEISVKRTKANCDYSSVLNITTEVQREPQLLLTTSPRFAKLLQLWLSYSEKQERWELKHGIVVKIKHLKFSEHGLEYVKDQISYYVFCFYSYLHY